MSCNCLMIFQTNIFGPEIHIFSLKLLTLALFVHNIESFVGEGPLYVLLFRPQFIYLLLLILKKTCDFLELSICSHWLISSWSGLVCRHFTWWNSSGVAYGSWTRIWHPSWLLEILWAISGWIQWFVSQRGENLGFFSTFCKGSHLLDIWLFDCLFPQVDSPLTLSLLGGVCLSEWLSISGHFRAAHKTSRRLYCSEFLFIS